MKSFWLSSVFPIAGLFSFRMLGLFMLIPVFTIQALQYSGATPVLIGIALGVYGLSQGLLQIPFGMLSDRYGRKPLIAIGLFLFFIGSLVGAATHSIYGIILARLLQGTGAIGSVLIALLADLTPDEYRTKSMAVIGATIGLSFSLAMVLSPALTHFFGFASIFYFSAFLAAAGLLLLFLIIPAPKKEPFHLDSEVKPALIVDVLKNSHLLRLNLGIFCQHLILTATFYVTPIILKEHIQNGALATQWKFYLPIMLLSFLGMLPLIFWAEKKKQVKPLFLSSIFITCICQFFLAWNYSHWSIFFVLMFIYFIGFNFLEANLPSLTSKQANPGSKGTAMGVYSSAQFLGIFAGGALAGFMFPLFNISGVFITSALIAFIWLVLSLSLQPNWYHTTLLIKCPDSLSNNQGLLDAIQKLSGVKQIIYSLEEELLYIRIDKSIYHSGSAELLLRESGLE